VNITQCSGRISGDKVFFTHLLLTGDAMRNEGWAAQQQSLDGYKPKFHGFFDFGVVEKKPWREIQWWCFKDKQDEEALAPFRKIEEERAAKKAEDLRKQLIDEEKHKEQAWAEGKKRVAKLKEPAHV